MLGISYRVCVIDPTVYPHLLYDDYNYLQLSE